MGQATGDPVRRLAALNRSVADHWDLFAGHRRRVTDLIVSMAGDPKVLYVLGAGNCNDLDLRRLVAVFDELHLVDIDIHAVRAGIRRQSMVDDRIRSHRVDLSGMADSLRRWTDAPPSNAEIDGALLGLEDGVARRWPRRPVGGVAASTGLLSQMTTMAIRALGAEHPRAVEVAIAIRDAHLRHLSRVLVPSGVGVVITDIASCGPGGTLVGHDPADPSALADRLADGGVVTTGTNPLGIEAALRAQPTPTVVEIARHRPWMWTLTSSEPRLVVAISFRRAGAAEARSESRVVGGPRHLAMRHARSMPSR